MANPVQTAQAVADAQAQLEQATAAHAAAIEATAEPREPLTIMLDLFMHFMSRAGNHPDLEKLMQELQAAAAKTRS